MDRYLGHWEVDMVFGIGVMDSTDGLILGTPLCLLHGLEIFGA